VPTTAQGDHRRTADLCNAVQHQANGDGKNSMMSAATSGCRLPASARQSDALMAHQTDLAGNSTPDALPGDKKLLICFLEFEMGRYPLSMMS